MSSPPQVIDVRYNNQKKLTELLARLFPKEKCQVTKEINNIRENPDNPT